MNKLGFGFLRLPKTGDEINYPLLNEMVDAFLSHGGTYFDTAYTYLDGKSEIALRESLVKRHLRESFILADKLPGWKIQSHADCQVYFEEQCQRCGVDYFDVYLLHWLNRDNYRICEKFDEFAFLRELKASGKAKKIGFPITTAQLCWTRFSPPTRKWILSSSRSIIWTGTAPPLSLETAIGWQHGVLGIAFRTELAASRYRPQRYELYGANAGQLAGCFASDRSRTSGG